MERRIFLRNSLLTAGGVLLGGSAIFRFLKESKPEEDFRPTTVETICQGNGKNVLVLMSAGTRQGDTDHLTDAYIERLYAISVEDKYPEKETVLLMTAGDNNEHTFDQALGYFHIISGVLGGKEVGTYLAGGCTRCENIARQIAPEHLEKVYKMGLEL
ncbi:hypothetical protein [uncultured Bacteroides sp.]|uniref:hypothetical protein n=1 Tax=uncultured Bacteroides sp. TaxID=162156 RepID=UPI0025A954BE|nr:hypothetical protein [uncultured Bacteroides sp.]